MMLVISSLIAQNSENINKIASFINSLDRQRKAPL